MEPFRRVSGPETSCVYQSLHVWVGSMSQTFGREKASKKTEMAGSQNEKLHVVKLRNRAFGKQD